MSCNGNYGDGDGYHNVCRQDIPYPIVSQESVPSLINNLATNLLGVITKTVSAGRIIWSFPCQLTAGANPIPSFPPQPNEGLICYLLRYIAGLPPTPNFGSKGFVIFDGTGAVGANQTILSSYNVSSVVKTAVGKYTINFSTPFPDTNYLMLNPYSQTENNSINFIQSEDLDLSPSRTTASISVFCVANNSLSDFDKFGAVFYR